MSERPWFLRVRTPLSYRLEPYSPAGWIATGIYMIGVVLLAMVPVRGELDRVEWIAWSIALAVWTIGYLVLAFRNSEAASVVLPDRKPRK
ncbi:hypothetical protein [Sphingomonas sp. S2-65]|uniref:hypothetical protein n=1 Tax=Sphingomonas sp. S2-65 TaxID=2903960 RepID=UPI001F40A86F|nr:hypothetical protein [Sphingomonas sp. S2-65]UYY57668.1 hypothetical protein LZ586_13510 [Sphingomonas sp. S2-65]